MDDKGSMYNKDNMDNDGCRDALQQNSKFLTTLLEVSNLVTSTMELRPLLEAILDKLRTIIEYRDAKIFIAKGDRVSVIAHRSKLKPDQERTYSLPLEKELLRNPVVIDDLLSDDELAGHIQGKQLDYMIHIFRTVLDEPAHGLQRHRHSIMTLDHTEPGYYKDYHGA